MRHFTAALTIALGSTLPAGSPAMGQDRPIGKTPICATADCHSGYARRTVPHAPVTDRRCLDCHSYDSVTDHTFALVAEGEDLCNRCHDRTEQTIVHKPVLDGRCIDCHDPHGSDHGSMLYDESEALCVRCHQQDFNNRDFVHGPVVVGACAVCHTSHSSQHEGLLVEPMERLCLDCHEDVAPPSQTVGVTLHAPMAGGCTSCHDPHASDHRFQLQSDVRELCFTCHGWMRDLVADSPMKHSPAGEEGGCTKCHNPHFSKLPKLQKMPQPALCLSCHDKALPLEDGTMLPDMEQLLKDNPDHHGPIREGACTACHNPHAGELFRLLYMQYPPEFYAPFKTDRYELCFSCHLKELVLDKSGRGLTGFRDGDLNLHWLHVNRQKGRTCRACHEVHASRHDFHIRESVPFGKGGWELPINFTRSDDGGNCRPGCHTEKQYSRTAESILLDSQPDNP